MKAIKINKTEFYTHFAIFNETGRIIALVKVENKNNICYEIELIEKNPCYLLPLNDFIRVNWR